MTRSFTTRMLIPLLLATLLTPALALAIIGGDPGDLVYYPWDGRELERSEPGLAITSSGVIFASLEREIGTLESETVILRSEDHGQSWTEWSVISFPDGDSAMDAELEVVTGLGSETLFLSVLQYGHPDLIWVYSTDATNPTPAWNPVLVEELPYTAGAYPRVFKVLFASRPSTVGPPTVGVAYWIQDGFFDFELHYAVSLDGGATFQPPLVLFDLSEPVGTSLDLDVELGFGGGGVVYVVGMLSSHTLTTESTRIQLITAVNDGATLGDWDLTPILITETDAWDYCDLTLASDPHGDDIVIGYYKIYSPDRGTYIMGSRDGGVTWQPGDLLDPEIDQHFELFWAAWGIMATAAHQFGDYYVLRPNGSILGPYEAGLYLRCGAIEVSTLRFALDPSQGNQTAVLAIMEAQWGQEDAVWFNADWRDQPGYAVSQEDWLEYGIGDYFVAAPGVADLNRDGVAEIVIAEDNGQLRLCRSNIYFAEYYYMGATGPSSVPVLYDLIGNQVPEVMVGGADGLLHVLDNNFDPIGNQPHDLGSGTDVYVSAGPVTGIGVGDIVAATGNAVHLLSVWGDERPGWPVVAAAGTVVGRAAIGDVDDDGQTEIVSVTTNGLGILAPDGTLEFYQYAGAAIPTAGVALADLDGDGDLEIAVPLSDGTVYLIHHDGTTYGTEWPFDSGTGSPVIGVSIAQVMTPANFAICFSTESGSVFAVNLAGSPLPNYPVAVAVGDTATSEPIIARVARPDTERPQLIVGTTGGWIHEWSALAQTPADWPNFYDHAPVVSPVAADVDGDGSQEMVVPIGDLLYVFDTATPPLGAPTRWWPMVGYDNARSGCLDCLPEPGLSGVDEPVSPDPEATGQSRIAFAGACPNPAPGRTAFQFSLPATADAALAVYDIRGQRVREFARQTLPPGEHTWHWDGCDGRGADVASGLYVARLVVSVGAVKRVMTRELTVRR
ncbi:MAG: FG-GAP-like repeat-containing protein [bacterium]